MNKTSDIIIDDITKIEESVCLLCGAIGLGFEGSNAVCPRCASTGRERLIYYWGKVFTNLFNTKISIIHFSPEDRLYTYFRHIQKVSEYYPTGYGHKNRFLEVDITDIGFDTGIFDLAVCSHVLEHVKDDEKAISEVWRILDMYGIGLFIVPLSNQDHTHEFDEPDEHDHWRQYSEKDFANKLMNHKFNVIIFKLHELKCDPGLSQETLFIAKKAARVIPKSS